MGGTAIPLCWSCGYSPGQAHGRNCQQSDWHRDPHTLKVDRKIALENNEEYRRIVSGRPPGWVRARVYVEAHKKGITASELVTKLLVEWAENHGGRT